MIDRTNAIVDPHTGKIIVQTPLPPINCLAIEGGGSRCPAYVGSYKVLVKSTIINEIVHVSGSSGGAICALAISLGYDPSEAESALLDLDLERFLEGSQSALSASSLYAKGKALLSILMSEKYSLSSGSEFLEWLRARVEKKMGNKHATFADLAKRVSEEGEGKSKYKYLYVTGTNLSLEFPECKIFSHETTPHMELALAAYISSCIPGVFPPVEYDGYLWADGGIIRNLPTKIFDESRFLPKGFGFTNKGVNPGVLALKVDTKAEIGQILYGIVRKVDLSTATLVVTALYNALAQNTDPDEIREARMTIALPDNNIGALEFSVNMHGKIGLITSAEKETQDFIENYYNSAYEVKVYENILDWLNALSIDEIDDVMVVYEKMNKLSEPNKNDTACINDSSAAKVSQYIFFLEAYLRYRRQLKRNSECKLEVSPPEHHINISLPCVNNNWSKEVECEMKEKLKHIRKQIIHLNKKIESMRVEFNDINIIDHLTLLHHHYHFENIRALTNNLETLKIFHEERKDLRIKLGIFIKQDDITARQNSKYYADFIQLLNPLLNSISIPEDLAIVLPDRLPVFKYKSSNTRGTIFSLDLRDESDRILYIIASLMYLNFIQSPNKELFIQLYRKFLPQKMLFPKNIQDLGVIFQTSGVESLVIAYRIEELLHIFERKMNPKLKPMLSIDTLFGVDTLYENYSAKNMQIKEEGEVAMKHIIHSNSIFCYNSADVMGMHSHSGDKHTGLTKSQHKLAGCTLSDNSEDASDSEDDSDFDCYKKPSWFMR